MFFKSEIKSFTLLKKTDLNRRFNFYKLDDYFIFVFLCGKAISEGDNRHFISKQLEINKKFSLYSEYLYEEFKETNLDLLTIEDILLSVCSATILIVESFGSACELGAFSFVSKNIDKLWVINDKKQMEKSSFIKDGPLKKISNIDESHVIIEEFKDGTIVFSDKSYKMFKTISRKTGFLEKEDFDPKTKICQINDLGLIICLLFDYIRMFGLIVEEHIIDVLKALYCKHDIDKFYIKLPSSELITDDTKIKIIFTKMLVILNKANVLIKNSNKDHIYYTLNYETMKNMNRNPIDFESFIYSSSYFHKVLLRKELSKISNLQVKEGFKIW